MCRTFIHDVWLPNLIWRKMQVFAEWPALREKGKEELTNRFSFFLLLGEGSGSHSSISLARPKEHDLLLKCFEWPPTLHFLPCMPNHSLCLLQTRWITWQQSSDSLCLVLCSYEVQILLLCTMRLQLLLLVSSRAHSRECAESLCQADFFVSIGDLMRARWKRVLLPECSRSSGDADQKPNQNQTKMKWTMKLQIGAVHSIKQGWDCEWLGRLKRVLREDSFEKTTSELKSERWENISHTHTSGIDILVFFLIVWPSWPLCPEQILLVLIAMLSCMVFPLPRTCRLWSPHVGAPWCFRFHLAQEAVLIPCKQVPPLFPLIAFVSMLGSLLGRTLLITSDRNLVGIRVGTHGEIYWLQ